MQAVLRSVPGLATPSCDRIDHADPFLQSLMQSGLGTALRSLAGIWVAADAALCTLLGYPQVYGDVLDYLLPTRDRLPVISRSRSYALGATTWSRSTDAGSAPCPGATVGAKTKGPAGDADPLVLLTATPREWACCGSTRLLVQRA